MMLRKSYKNKKKLPLFHAYGLKLSPFPLVSTRKGPISCVAPYPTEEQPGPVYITYMIKC